MAAYPKAKVILTTRDPDSWVRSMESCYYRVLNMLQGWDPLLYYEPVRPFAILHSKDTYIMEGLRASL